MSAFRTTESILKMQRQCEAFNAKHKVGDAVRIWVGKRGGEGEIVHVMEPGAFILGGHTAVVFTTGAGGCISLSHVAEA